MFPKGKKKGDISRPSQVIAEENFKRSEFVELRPSGYRFRAPPTKSRKRNHPSASAPTLKSCVFCTRGPRGQLDDGLRHKFRADGWMAAARRAAFLAEKATASKAASLAEKATARWAASLAG